MIDTDPREQVQGGLYQPPTFHELVAAAQQLELINGYEEGLRGIRMQVVGQLFDLSVRDAEMLLTGLLLGYFSLVSFDDDLTPAAWNH